MSNNAPVFVEPTCPNCGCRVADMFRAELEHHKSGCPQTPIGALDTRTMWVVMKAGIPIFATHILDLALKAQVENETKNASCTIIPVSPVPEAPKQEPAAQLELPLDDFDDEPTNPDFLLGHGPKL